MKKIICVVGSTVLALIIISISMLFIIGIATIGGFLMEKFIIFRIVLMFFVLTAVFTLFGIPLWQSLYKHCRKFWEKRS